MPHWGCWTSMLTFLCIYIFVSQKSLGLSLAIKLSPDQLESCIADSMYCLFVFTFYLLYLFAPNVDIQYVTKRTKSDYNLEEVL